MRWGSVTARRWGTPRIRPILARLRLEPAWMGEGDGVRIPRPHGAWPVLELACGAGVALVRISTPESPPRLTKSRRGPTLIGVIRTILWRQALAVLLFAALACTPGDLHGRVCLVLLGALEQPSCCPTV